jgi:anti-sigma factor RsiW
MNHVLDLLQRYVDGEATVAERTTVERHCANCSDCRAALEALESLWARVETAAGAPPLSDRRLWPAVADRLKAAAEGAGRRGDRRTVRIALPGVALAAGLALGLLVGRGPGTAPPNEDTFEAQLASESVLLGSGDRTLGGLWLAAAEAPEVER